MRITMSNKFDVSTLNGLFKEIYASKISQMIPNGAVFYPPDYEKMPIDVLAQYDNIEAKKVYARRTTKLGKYLEGAEWK
jgi:hypothetical protein